MPRTAPERYASLRRPYSRILTPVSPEFSVSPTLIGALFGSSSGAIAWASVNDPLALPFALSYPVVAAQLGWCNGTTLNDNIDVGIYDTAWNRLVSTGSVALAGASAWQWSDIADTLLPAGRYYLACSRDGTTTQDIVFYGAVPATVMALAGVQDSTTDAFPLPNPLTNMGPSASGTRIPQIGIATRVPFA